MRCPEEETMTATYPLSLGVSLGRHPVSAFHVPPPPPFFSLNGECRSPSEGNLASGSYRYTMAVCMACGTNCATAAADDGAGAGAGAAGAAVVAPARY